MTSAGIGATVATVELRDATRRFGGAPAVDRVSFRVEPGEMFGLIGPDGAGKSTLLRVVLGLLRLDGGTVRTCGLDPFGAGREVASKVGYVSQGSSLYGDLTVDENLAFFAEIQAASGGKARREELLELLQLAAFRRRLADQLSGGMKRKLALACTLLHDPELLVLDEPTTGVDPVSRRDFWGVLARIQAGGVTILLATPSLDEAERCSRVAFLHHGRVLTVDSPESIRDSEPHALLEVVASPRRRAAELLRARTESPRVIEVETFGERLHVTLEGASPPRDADAAATIGAGLRRAGIEVAGVRAIRPSLEDVFLRRMRGEATP